MHILSTAHITAYAHDHLAVGRQLLRCFSGQLGIQIEDQDACLLLEKLLSNGPTNALGCAGDYYCLPGEIATTHISHLLSLVNKGTPGIPIPRIASPPAPLWVSKRRLDRDHVAAARLQDDLQQWLRIEIVELDRIADSTAHKDLQA